MTQPNCIDCNKHYIDCQCVKGAGVSCSPGFGCCMAARTQKEWKRSFWQVGAFRGGETKERLKWLMELTKQTRPAVETINPYL